MIDLLEWKETLAQRGILISFNGTFSHSLIEELGNALKIYLEGARLRTGIVTDVFAVYIEQTQNVRNYVQRRQLVTVGHDAAIVIIGQSSGFYTISAGNVIETSDVSALRERLEEANALDKDGLKRRYKEELRKDRAPGAVGAGVGILDMARRASGRLEYTFNPIDDVFSFFTLAVTVAGA